MVIAPETAATVLPQPDDSAIAELQSLYDSGRFLDAWHFSQRFAPLEAWTATPALVLGGRLASRWGNNFLSNQLHQRAHRKSPQDDDAFYYFILTIHFKHGPLEALRLITERTSRMEGAPKTEAQANLWVQQARLLTGFRDFDAAEACLATAEHACPDNPWLWAEKSAFLQAQDRYEEGLAAARHACALRPWYRPGIHQQVHLLQLLGRDDEALRLLEESQAHIQCYGLVQSQVLMMDESSRNAEMLPLLDRLAELQPLASLAHIRWRAARRCDAHHRLGNASETLAAAREAGPGYYEELAKRLVEPAKPDDRRVQLPVGFVRQHHMTCAPATMTALGRFWGEAVDHEALAREICYDGTPAHLERAWAETNGWCIREFRVTWESARALLDRGCPFALVTTGIRSGHMQAVIGYDSRLGTLLIRDPYQRSYSEWDAEALFKNHVASGPRGMVMIPRDKAPLLDGIELPDEALHTQLHLLQLALSRHERTAAGVALAALESLDPDHLLTLRARFEIAYYDANPGQALPPVRRLRERLPDDVNLQLDELQLLNQLGRTSEHRELLSKLGNRPSAPLVFQRQEAEELTRDARHHPRAFKLLRRALRRHASDARTLSAFAHLLWRTRRHEEATRLYRLAASCDDKVEAHWDSYFKASRHLGETDESLALIRHRFDQWGARSSQPARTLFECLEALDRSHDAFDVLAKARDKRPDDGDLLLFAAETHGRYGRYADAAELMTAASTRTSPAAWRRTAASIASYQGDHAQSRDHWREIATLNPSDSFAHSSIARLSSLLQGREAALAYLHDACAAQPQQLALRETQIQWLRGESAERLLAAVDSFLELDPANAWAHRERALVLLRLQRSEEALAAARHALHIAPFEPASHGILGDMLRGTGQLHEARKSYRQGIQLSIDADWLFADLLAACPDFPTRREAVLFIKDELLRQTSLADACLQFRATARAILTPEEMQESLEALWRRHPEVWSTWSVLVNHLADQNRLPEALARASDAASRFPLTPRTWLDLASVHAAMGADTEAATAYEKGLAISPAWGTASRQLSRIHEKTLRLDLAAQVLQRAVDLDPRDAYSHAWLADVLWRQHSHDAAIARMEKAIEISPDFGWAWGKLNEWSKASGHDGLVLRIAEALTQTRPGEAESWMRLAQMRFKDHSPDANLEALDKAAALAPRNPDVHDARAELLASHKRYDEALEACRPAVFGSSIPVSLQGRAAWIEHRRGNRDRAIDRMNAVVESQPDYTWGWSLLTTWYWESEKYGHVKTAAARWAWLDTNTAMPHGYIAAVHKSDGKREEAKAAFARALAADPAYDYGAFELFRLQLFDKEISTAGQTLRHIETHFSPAEYQQALVEFHDAAKDEDAVIEALRALARIRRTDPAEFKQAVAYLSRAGRLRLVEKALAPLLADPASVEETGRQWTFARQKKSFVWTLLLAWRLKPTPAIRRNIDSMFIEQLTEVKSAWSLYIFCRIRRRALRSHDETWGQVGYAFNTLLRFSTVVRWMKDWRERPSAPPWMSVNLVQSLYSRKRIAEAREALMAALEKPRDHTHDLLLIWLACEQALDGSTDAAQATRDSITNGKLSDYDKALLTFTDCMIRVQRAPAGEKQTALADSRDQIARKREELPAVATAPALIQFYRRTLRRLGTDGGSLWLRIRSRLPLMGPANGFTSVSFPDIPAPLAWGGIVVLFMALKACLAAIG